MPKNAVWAAWLARRMNEVGLSSIAELSRASGVGHTVISRWLDGSTPTIAHLKLLTRPLHVSLGRLLVESGQATVADLVTDVSGVSDAETSIRTDPGLDEDLRSLLLVQYRHMTQLTATRRQLRGSSGRRG